MLMASAKARIRSAQSSPFERSLPEDEPVVVDDLDDGPVPARLRGAHLDDNALLRPGEEQVVPDARGDRLPKLALVGAPRRPSVAHVRELRGGAGEGLARHAHAAHRS
jgi:hypothetical protein